jgi:hypothetical protein
MLPKYRVILGEANNLASEYTVAVACAVLSALWSDSLRESAEDSGHYSNR